MDNETQIEVPASTSNRARRAASGNDQASPQTEPRYHTHITMQSKGGVGKTTIAYLIAQYLMEAGRTPICFDVDPGNDSLARFLSLNANHVSLYNGETNEVDVDGMDTLLQAMLTEKSELVIDGGAGSFQSLADYLIRMDAPQLLDAHNRVLMIHSVLVGEPDADHTMNGLTSLLDQMPAPAKFVVWLNEYNGPVSKDGVRFEETEVYAKHRSKIAGIVTLPQQHRYYAQDVKAMLSKRQTFAEAIKGALIPNAQRLTQVRRAVWGQLANVL